MENTEPQGIRDLREAKADYLASLSKLREADAELVKAQAAYQSAQIAVVEADAALKQAEANIAQALADAAQLGVAYLDAKLQIELEDARAQAEIAAVEAQKTLAEKQAELEVALRKIAAESIGLTDAEKTAIGNKAYALKVAQDNYHTAFVDVENAKKAIWEKEYLHDSTEFEYLDVYREGYSWRLKTDYNNLITLKENAIADAEKQIASDEALLEDHTAVKDSLDAMKAIVKDLEEDKLIAEQKLDIYEAGEFNEAKDAYKKAVETFKEDSVDVYATDPFAFVDLDEDENPVAKEYDLTDGKRVDEKFVLYLNNWQIISDKNYNCPAEYGYKGDDDVIKVGITSNNAIATPEQLEKAIVIVDEIVEGLNRELVVIDNITDSSDIETLKKTAEAAKKAYETDRDTISKGLSKYQPYIDSVKKVAALAQDTVNAKAKYVEADSIAKLALKDKNTKDAAQIVEVRKAEATYKTAVKALFSAVDDYALRQAASRLTTNDSTKFVAAINAFGAAQAAFLGHQDSLICKKGYDPETGIVKEYKEALSEISLANFKKGKDDKIPYGEIGFAEVLKKINKNAFDVWKGTEAQWLAAVENILTGKTTVADSIVAAKNIAAVKDAIAAFETSKKVSHEKDSIATALNTKFQASKERFNNYDGDDVAKADYLKVVSRFWNRETSVADTAAYKFPWTDKTFFEPENCVVFNLETGSIIRNNELVIALNGVENPSIPYGKIDGADVNDSKIFRGTHGKTEFAKYILASQIAEEAGDYVTNKARLEKINAQVAQIKTDVEAAIAEYDAANAAYVAAWTRLTGKKNGNYQPELYRSLVDQDKGVWKLGGKQLELANQFAPEYPEYVTEWKFAITVIQEKIDRANNYINTLKWCYERQVAFETGDDYRTLESLISILENDIRNQENNIKYAKQAISAYKYALAQIEAGYDPYSIEMKVLYDELERCENALEIAEEALARAQKEYAERTQRPASRHGYEAQAGG